MIAEDAKRRCKISLSSRNIHVARLLPTASPRLVDKFSPGTSYIMLALRFHIIHNEPTTNTATTSNENTNANVLDAPSRVVLSRKKQITCANNCATANPASVK